MKQTLLLFLLIVSSLADAQDTGDLSYYLSKADGGVATLSK
jgi:hypothetical protein